MRTLLLAVMAWTLCILPLMAQEGSETQTITNPASSDSLEVPFIAYWSVGDSYDFRITKIIRKWKDDVLQQNDSIEYTAKFTVIDSTETSYKVKWSFENILARRIAKQFSLEALPEAKEPEQLDVIYITDELGTYQGVENWKEIADKTEIVFDELIKSTPKKRRKIVKQLLEPIKTSFITKAGIETAMLKELPVFHFPMGVSFLANKVIEYDDEFAVPFSSGPITAKSWFKLHDVDTANGYCIISQRSEADQESALKLIKTLFQQMQLGEKEEISLKLEDAVFDIQDENIYEYFYNPGVPNFIQTHRVLNANLGEGHIKRQDILRIELFFPEEEEEEVTQ
ncbi:hypothetical protein FUAX_07050 [Fulvitalea axinellae]|uniref:Uncharacterized protein n=1 Tax=Fulvitalea axinellae TaxID=1182444 RepID=A0AAU9CXF3_9BACT|nr:hypothetical protein FUAX_07050 [Fulvitalea axinellae]